MIFNFDNVRSRLVLLGCSEINEPAVMFAVDKTTSLIKSNCNVTEVPEGLYETAIDIACGEYLLSLHSTGQAIGGIIDDLPKTIKSIQEGDTKVDFAVSENTDQIAQFQLLINYLLRNRSNFGRYRRLTW